MYLQQPQAEEALGCHSRQSHAGVCAVRLRVRICVRVCVCLCVRVHPRAVCGVCAQKISVRTHSHAHTHTRAHARARTHTHTGASEGRASRERALSTRRWCAGCPWASLWTRTCTAETKDPANVSASLSVYPQSTQPEMRTDDYQKRVLTKHPKRGPCRFAADGAGPLTSASIHSTSHTSLHVGMASCNGRGLSAKRLRSIGAGR
jgi:hypothetical protein